MGIIGGNFEAAAFKTDSATCVDALRATRQAENVGNENFISMWPEGIDEWLNIGRKWGLD